MSLEIQVELEPTRTDGPSSRQVVERKTGQEDQYGSRCYTVGIVKWLDILRKPPQLGDHCSLSILSHILHKYIFASDIMIYFTMCQILQTPTLALPGTK